MNKQQTEIYTIKSKDKCKFIDILTKNGVKKIKRTYLINNIIDKFSNK